MKLGTKRLAAAVLALALFGSACGSDGSSETAAGSPLSELLGDDGFGFNFDPDDPAAQARYNEQEQQRQEVIASCMSEEGFEYIPVDQSSFNFADMNGGLDYDSREYAEKYGFGMTTQHMSQTSVGPDLVGYDDTMFEEMGNDDPNQEIVEAMDPSTQEAYYLALYGAEPEIDPNFDPDTATEEELEDLYSFEPQGCFGEAYAGDNANNFYNDFEDELEEMWASIEDDPRIVEARLEIENCVADSGYDFSMDSDGYEALWNQFQDRLAEVDAEAGAFPFEEMTEEDFEAMTDDELDAMMNFSPELSDTGKAILGELQAEETAMAVAVWDCGGSFGDSEMADLFQEVSVEYEQRFIDQNADRLEDYRS
jgi:hypothetical protein